MYVARAGMRAKGKLRQEQWGASASREVLPNAKLGWSDDIGILSVWMEPAKTALKWCMLYMSFLLSSRAFQKLVGPPVPLPEPLFALQRYKDVSDSHHWEAQEKGWGMELFFCHQNLFARCR